MGCGVKVAVKDGALGPTATGPDVQHAVRVDVRLLLVVQLAGEFGREGRGDLVPDGVGLAEQDIDGHAAGVAGQVGGLERGDIRAGVGIPDRAGAGEDLLGRLRDRRYCISRMPVSLAASERLTCRCVSAVWRLPCAHDRHGRGKRAEDHQEHHR